jgi:hypothetical protein
MATIKTTNRLEDGIITWFGRTKKGRMCARIMTEDQKIHWREPGLFELTSKQGSDHPLYTKMSNMFLDKEADKLLAQPYKEPTILAPHTWESPKAIGLILYLTDPSGFCYAKKMIFFPKSQIMNGAIQEWLVKKAGSQLLADASDEADERAATRAYEDEEDFAKTFGSDDYDHRFDANKDKLQIEGLRKDGKAVSMTTYEPVERNNAD